MKQNDKFRARKSGSKRASGPGKRRFRLLMIMAVIACCAALFGAVEAYNRLMSNSLPTTPPEPAPVSRAAEAMPGHFYGKLSVQPVANRFRLMIGKRFSRPGKELSMLGGRLTVGSQNYEVMLTRAQSREGESVSVSFDKGLSSLTWDTSDGARSPNGPASEGERTIIERLALDSPDQFVLAQLRGASYYTVGRDVRPIEAGNSDDYDGPVWDMIHVEEPPADRFAKPQNLWRLYYINSSTGLIDKIVSREDGVPVVAELSNWVSRDGELLPSLITWKRDGQTVMEFAIGSVAYQSAQ